MRIVSKDGRWKLVVGRQYKLTRDWLDLGVRVHNYVSLSLVAFGFGLRLWVRFYDSTKRWREEDE